MGGFGGMTSLTGGTSGWYTPPIVYKPPVTNQTTYPNSTTQYTPPPPPVIPPPAPFVLPPPVANQWLPQLQALIASFQNAKPYGDLGGDIQALLAKYKDAALQGLQQDSTAAQGTLLGRLFGRNMPQSSDAIHQSDDLATRIGVARANIENTSAQQELAARQYAGGFGLQSLGQQGGLLTAGAGLQSSENQNAIQNLLSAAGLNNQQYATQGGLANQLYGQQSSNYFNTQQLSFQDRQMLYDFLTKLLSGGLGGANLGGSGGLLGGSQPPAGGVGGGWAATGTGTGTLNIQQIIQMIMKMFGGGTA